MEGDREYGGVPFQISWPRKAHRDGGMCYKDMGGGVECIPDRNRYSGPGMLEACPSNSFSVES